MKLKVGVAPLRQGAESAFRCALDPIHHDETDILHSMADMVGRPQAASGCFSAAASRLRPPAQSRGQQPSPPQQFFLPSSSSSSSSSSAPPRLSTLSSDPEQQNHQHNKNNSAQATTATASYAVSSSPRGHDMQFFLFSFCSVQQAPSSDTTPRLFPRSRPPATTTASTSFRRMTRLLCSRASHAAAAAAAHARVVPSSSEKRISRFEQIQQRQVKISSSRSVDDLVLSGSYSSASSSTLSASSEPLVAPALTPVVDALPPPPQDQQHQHLLHPAEILAAVAKSLRRRLADSASAPQTATLQDDCNGDFWKDLAAESTQISTEGKNSLAILPEQHQITNQKQQQQQTEQDDEIEAEKNTVPAGHGVHCVLQPSSTQRAARSACLLPRLHFFSKAKRVMKSQCAQQQQQQIFSPTSYSGDDHGSTAAISSRITAFFSEHFNHQQQRQMQHKSNDVLLRSFPRFSVALLKSATAAWQGDAKRSAAAKIYLLGAKTTTDAGGGATAVGPLLKALVEWMKSKSIKSNASSLALDLGTASWFGSATTSTSAGNSCLRTFFHRQEQSNSRSNNSDSSIVRAEQPFRFCLLRGERAVAETSQQRHPMQLYSLDESAAVLEPFASVLRNTKKLLQPDQQLCVAASQCTLHAARAALYSDSREFSAFSFFYLPSSSAPALQQQQQHDMFKFTSLWVGTYADVLLGNKSQQQQHHHQQEPSASPSPSHPPLWLVGEDDESCLALVAAISVLEQRGAIDSAASVQVLLRDEVTQYARMPEEALGSAVVPAAIILAPSALDVAKQYHNDNINEDEDDQPSAVADDKMLAVLLRARFGAGVHIVSISTHHHQQQQHEQQNENSVIISASRCAAGDHCSWCDVESSHRSALGIDIEHVDDGEDDGFQISLLSKSGGGSNSNNDDDADHQKIESVLGRIRVELGRWKFQHQEQEKQKQQQQPQNQPTVLLPDEVVVRSVVPFLIDHFVLYQLPAQQQHQSHVVTRICILVDIPECDAAGAEGQHAQGQLHQRWLLPLRAQAEHQQREHGPSVSISVKSVRAVIAELSRVASAAIQASQQHRPVPHPPPPTAAAAAPLSLLFLLVSSGTAESSERVLSALASSCASFIDYTSSSLTVGATSVSTALVLVPPVEF